MNQGPATGHRATIRGENDRQILLTLHADGDAYRWYDGDEDVELSGETYEAALQALRAAYSMSHWGLEMAKEMTITANAEEVRKEFAPLMCWYPGQSEPQPAHIELDPEEGGLRADWNREIGNAVPMDVWHGRTYRLSVSPYIRGSVLAAMLEDPAFLGCIGRICAGHSVKWDGHNWVGGLTEDGMTARLEAEEWLADNTLEGDEVVVMDVGEWLVHCPDEVTAATTDDEIDTLAKAMEQEARDENILLLGDIAEHLRTLRDDRADQ